MNLHEAFDIVRGDVVALIGAGGKTSMLIGLGYELFELGWRVVATTTTRIAEEQLSLMPCAMRYTNSPEVISEALTEHGFVFLYDEIRDGKVYGPQIDWTPQLLDSIDSDVLLIEADGSRGLPVKAPFEHEPVIPKEATLVIVIASLAALGKPLDENNVYNAQAMVDRFGFYPGSKIRAPWLAQILRDEEMGLRGVPPNARVMAFLNQTPKTGYLRARARQIARMALRGPRLRGVALGSVRAADPVSEIQRSIGAVILAAGQSSRMGQPKVLLPWADGRTILEHIIEQLLRSHLDHIVVVTGYYADEVKQVAKPYDVKIVHNRSFKTGEMLSSLKAGLRSMPDQVQASLVVLGDQPTINPKVIYRVLRAYAEGEGHIVAPSYQMRRGHPILISRRYWGEILSLGRNAAPRDVINAHADEIAYVNVATNTILDDVDTPSDYYRALRQAGITPQDLKKPRRD